jgi:glycerol-3-phosphate cytidylyltransferase
VNVRIGITFGAFDLFHTGHVLMLKEARQNCDFLIVCIQVDPSVDRPAKHKPVQTILEREIQVAACQYVDQVLIYETEKDLENILVFFPWHVRFLDVTYAQKPITAEWTREWCHYTKRGHNYSTSELRDRVKKS